MKTILRAYECSLDGKHWSTINALSKGKAKSEFLSDIDWDVRYIDVRCRVLGDVKFHTPEGFKKNARYRNIPFAYCGMKVELSGSFGWIVGHNCTANLNVLFYTGEYIGQTLNCHPNWMLKYFDEEGNVIKDFEKEPLR